MKPVCPRCRTNKQIVPQGDLYVCRRCGALLDDDPDEGGDYSDRSPAARLEREERRRAAQQEIQQRNQAKGRRR